MADEHKKGRGSRFIVHGRLGFQKASSLLNELQDELADLEDARVALLKRLDQAREKLLLAGQKRANASVATRILQEHLREGISGSDMHALQFDVLMIDDSLEESSTEAASLIFEADGLCESVGDGQAEMERLLDAIVDTRPRGRRGH